MPPLVRKIEKRVLETVCQYDLVAKGEGVVVAVSGGPDSVCLLHILHNLRRTLEVRLFVAHFDHGLRPDEDEAETTFVASMAETMGLPFVAERGNIRLGPSLEDRARKARYAFLERARERFSAAKIALGHQRNDQAETVLMRLLRGSGLAGLSGIRPIRDGTIIRPLLQLRRSEIEAYLKKKNLSFKTDQTNWDGRFLRNKIRQDLLPRFREYQPRTVDILSLTAERLRVDHEYLEEIAVKWAEKEVSILPNGQVTIGVMDFRELEKAIQYRIIRHCVDGAGGNPDNLTQNQISAVQGLARGRRPQAEVHLSRGLTVRRIYDRLVFGRFPQTGTPDYRYDLKGPGIYIIKALGTNVTVERLSNEGLIIQNNPPWTACFDGAKTTFPLSVRNFRPGDRFVPLGMKGHKKLKDLFVDLKIPNRIRATTPILTCGNRIMWVCGLRIDDRFKVSKETKRIVRVAFSDGIATTY